MASPAPGRSVAGTFNQRSAYGTDDRARAPFAELAEMRSRFDRLLEVRIPLPKETAREPVTITPSAE